MNQSKNEQADEIIPGLATWQMSAMAVDVYKDILKAMEPLEGPFVSMDDYLFILADLKRRCATQMDNVVIGLAPQMDPLPGQRQAQVMREAFLAELARLSGREPDEDEEAMLGRPAEQIAAWIDDLEGRVGFDVTRLRGIADNLEILRGVALAVDNRRILGAAFEESMKR